MRGGSFKSFLKKAGRFFKKSKILSTLGTALGSAGVPYAGSVGAALKMAGLGRRRRKRVYRRARRVRHGGSLKLAGQGIGLAGGMRQSGMCRIKKGGMRRVRPGKASAVRYGRRSRLPRALGMTYF